MREILFRGKRIDNGEWAFGSYCLAEKLDRNGNEHCIIEYAANGGSYCVDPSTIGQYTGLTDKNGKRIFEGDIISFRTGRPQVVRFEDGSFIIGNSAIPVKLANRFEVIGNIHDKPEFLID